METIEKMINGDNNTMYMSRDGEVENLARAIALGMNCLITGATGCGKTTLVHYVTEKLNKKVISIQGAEGVVYEQVVGYRDVKSVNGTIQTRWVDGMIPKAMKQEDTVLYVDEPNALPQGVVFYLFSAMDYRRSIVIADNEGETVNAKPGFMVIGAMNEGYGYGGTNMLNHAFRDRFDIVIDLATLPRKQEIELLIAKSGIDKENATLIVSIAEKLREASDNKVISIPISTRTLITWAKLIKLGMSITNSCEVTLLGRLSSTNKTHKKAILDIVEAHIAGNNNG